MVSFRLHNKANGNPCSRCEENRVRGVTAKFAANRNKGNYASISTSLCSGSFGSSVCSTPTLPAGLQTFPDVAFHRRTRPSFPTEESIVLDIKKISELKKDVKFRNLPRDIPFNPTHRRSIKNNKKNLVKENTQKRKKFNGLVLIKISHGNGGPLRFLALIFTRSFVIVLRSRFDFPNPHMPIPAARGDKVVRPTTRRCPSDRGDGKSRGYYSSSP